MIDNATWQRRISLLREMRASAVSEAEQDALDAAIHAVEAEAPLPIEPLDYARLDNLLTSYKSGKSVSSADVTYMRTHTATGEWLDAHKERFKRRGMRSWA